MDNERLTPEMIDALRPDESDRSVEAKLMGHALRQIDWQARRIAELEASEARLRAVLDWLDERERAFPEKVFPPLLGYEQGKINRTLQRIGICRDRVSADISRLWCQQLREAIDAPPEVDRD